MKISMVFMAALTFVVLLGSNAFAADARREMYNTSASEAREAGKADIRNIISAAQSPPAPEANTPHYYAVSLREFMREPGVDATAILVDLDDDGFEEMLAFKFLYTDGGYDVEGEFVLNVYDIIDGKNTVASIRGAGNYIFMKTDQMYVSENNFIITDLGGGDGNYQDVYSYKDGSLTLSSIAEGAGWGCEINRNDATKNEYDQFCERVGVGKPKKAIIDEYGAYKLGRQTNDSAKILAMTAAPQSQALTVIFRGKALDLPVINKNGRTYYPMRELFEALGAEVEWNSATRTATGALVNNSVEFTIGAGTYKVNGADKSMDAGVTPFIYNGKTYIPIRDAATGLGFSVEWDNAAKTIVIK